MCSKLIEALTKVSDILETWGDHLPPIIQDKAKEALALADKALAEPIRNCEVGTAEEQIERWRKFCHKFEQCDECPHMRNGELLSHGCFARWSQMSYEEGETK